MGLPLLIEEEEEDEEEQEEEPAQDCADQVIPAEYTCICCILVECILIVSPPRGVPQVSIMISYDVNASISSCSGTNNLDLM